MPLAWLALLFCPCFVSFFPLPSDLPPGTCLQELMGENGVEIGLSLPSGRLALMVDILGVQGCLRDKRFGDFFSKVCVASSVSVFFFFF